METLVATQAISQITQQRSSASLRTDAAAMQSADSAEIAQLQGWMAS